MRWKFADLKLYLPNKTKLHNKNDSVLSKNHPYYLVVVDKFLQLIGVHHNVQAAHLSQSVLARVHASEAHLLPCAG